VSTPTPTDDSARRGEHFLREIRQQPDVLAALAANDDRIAAIATEIRHRSERPVRMIAHGSSDNAASYGVYAFGLLAGVTAFRDSISLSVYYGAELDVRGSSVLALSQSGRTPDVVDYLERARRRGAFTIAVTNDPGSPLADCADAVLPLGAGTEQAIAATKTYSAQLAALALLAAHTANDGARYHDGLHAQAATLAELLARPRAELTPVIEELAPASRMLVLGRGPEYATARELALKLLETCRLAADALTATDLAHGPVAALDTEFPVWVITANDASLPIVVEAAQRAHRAGARVIATGPASDAIDAASLRIPLPESPLPLLAPLLSIAPGQLVASGLAAAKGLDPDSPGQLAKVTLAR
jgi:glucosamine--fructose-6-phosphate aminotransferase (isomerizing)